MKELPRKKLLGISTMKIFILLSAVTLVFAKERFCGENQRYLECGTACPLTCDNYANPPKICPAMCVSGCHCEKGYVKTEDGRCVRPEECPARTNPVCGENQRFESCGSACPLTCDNYDNPPRICPAMCVIGCHCEKGYVKTSDGRCVRPEECPARSNRNVESCLLKPETGMCRAYIPLWYYDADTETCKKFVYGGCGGNENRHTTKEECMQNCGNVRRQSTFGVCHFPADPGFCDAYMPRFFYDISSGECKRFVYGGCGGNGNNFRTIEECQKACA